MTVISSSIFLFFKNANITSSYSVLRLPIKSSTISSIATNKLFEFGNSDPGFINEALDGRIGQVWNYSRRLAPQEIYQVYQSTRDRYEKFI
jgi:hypothetical protein